MALVLWDEETNTEVTEKTHPNFTLFSGIMAFLRLVRKDDTEEEFAEFMNDCEDRPKNLKVRVI